jgi:hypothetical protein
MTGITPMVREGSPGRFPPPWRRRAFLAIRAALIVAWLGWAAMAWWSAPRPADADQARSDLTAGAVSSYTRASTWDRSEDFWGNPPTARAAEDGALVVWTTTSGQVRYATPDLPGRPDESAGGSGDGLRQADALTALFAADRAIAGNLQLPSTARTVASVMMLVFLFVLITGPAPVRGTRFFWFWIALSPFGLGVLAWLATERPWSRRAWELSRPWSAEAVSGTRRRSGFLGFGLLLVGSIVASLLVAGLREVFGPGIISG